MSENRLTQMPDSFNSTNGVPSFGLIKTITNKIKETHPGIFDNFNWNDFTFFVIPKEQDIYGGLQQAKRETLSDNGLSTDNLDDAYNFTDQLAYKIKDIILGCTGGNLELEENEYTVNRIRKYVTRRATYVIFKLRDTLDIKRKYINPNVLFIFKFNELPTVDDALRHVGLSGEYTFEYDQMDNIINAIKYSTLSHSINVDKQQLSDNHIRATFKVGTASATFESNDPSYPVTERGSHLLLLRNSEDHEEKVVFSFVRDAVEKVEINDDIEDKALNADLNEIITGTVYNQN